MTKVQEGSTAGLIHNLLLRCARILLQQLGIVVLPNASSLRLQAVVKLQSRWRRALSREATRRFLASRDELLALPGTRQGAAGWYEFLVNGERMAVKYAYENERWQLVSQPVPCQ